MVGSAFVDEGNSSRAVYAERGHDGIVDKYLKYGSAI